VVGKYCEGGGRGAGKFSAVEMPDQHFGRRLLKNSEFQKVYAEGQKKSLPGFTLHWMKVSHHGNTRVGITAGRKIGPAVLRNRVKRRLRELVRTYPQAISPGYWIVLSGRRECANESMEVLKRCLYSSINEILT
jgi:ribonuclease P protein component